MNFRKIICFFIIASSTFSYALNNKSIGSNNDVPEDSGSNSNNLIKPIAIILPIDIQLDEKSKSTEVLQSFSRLIRQEIDFSDEVNLIGLNVERTIIEKGEYLNGIQSDSLAKEVALSSGATHLVTYQINETENKYQLTLKAFRVNSNFETTWIRIGMLRYSKSFPKDIESVDHNVRKATWRILGISPPDERFPKDPLHVEFIELCKLKLGSLFSTVEYLYGPTVATLGCTAIVLGGGYGIYALSSNDNVDNSSDGIGFPPDYPEAP